MPKRLLSVLCIGGLDPSGGAGLLADARACAAFGVHGLGVATATVPQNTREVLSIHPVDAESVAAQIEAILADISPDAIKIGMLPNREIASVLIGLLKPLRGTVPIVMDPVLAPSCGPDFLRNADVEYLVEELFPLVDVLTPNVPEARQLSGQDFDGTESMETAARAIHQLSGAKYVLLKGGHLGGEEALDLLFDGNQTWSFLAPRIAGYEVRGTGCQLASAIAARLADRASVPEAVREVKGWLTDQIRDARELGGGRLVTAPAFSPAGYTDITRK